MEDTLKTYLSPEMFEDVIRFQEARIQALENRNRLLEHMREESFNDLNAIQKAESETIDWINHRILGI
jgi:hypothetical protein